MPVRNYASPFRTFVTGGLLLLNGCSVPQKKPATATLQTDKYAEHVRTTPFQSPEAERRGFRLPPGFEITLFASEPDISKPMNIEFDDRGRLWVTQSTAYPLAAEQGGGKDKITILEDTNGDGRADKFTEFKNDLNIPIGIMPMTDGAIAYSIPYLYYFRDKDNDGKADDEKKLLGPFGYNDTHGMVNNLLRGFDGWVHSSHGFSNTSHIAGADGDSIRMFSGNTFRFRTDGSRVEQTTFGRVNPFGFSYDERGYLYSVDCHSKPIYQLIPYADYPHFGKKPTGIGFGPEMTSYELGSTALAGLVYYTGEQFPAEYRNNFFVGDVVTSRISRNSVSFTGSTPSSRFEENFLLSDDPWFRPVDIKVGPDGALYVADFYNRIIGHYEVSLTHPGRDRVSGRIWRITYKGRKAKSKDWSQASLEELLAGLNYPQLNIRMRLADRIFDTHGPAAVPGLKKLLEAGKADARSQVQALWLLHRLGNLTGDLHMQFLKSPDETIRVHALRILAQQKTLPAEMRKQVMDALGDTNPFVVRTAAEVLYHFPDNSQLEPLLRVFRNTPEADSHLKYTLLLSIRQTMTAPSVLAGALKTNWQPEARRLLCRAMLDLPSRSAADFVYEYLLTGNVPAREAEPYFEYVARYVHPAQVDGALAMIGKTYAGEQTGRMMMYQALSRGLTQSGRPLTPKLKALEQEAAKAIIASYAEKPFPALHAASPAEKSQFAQACRVAGQYRMAGVADMLKKVLPDGSPLEFQTAAVDALAAISPTAYSTVFRNLFTDLKTFAVYKEILAPALGKDPTEANLLALKNSLPGSSRKLQAVVANTLAGSKAGVAHLLAALENGEAPVSLLSDNTLSQAIARVGTAEQKAAAAALLEKNADSAREREAIIKERTEGILAYRGTPAKGREIFSANCSPCHQIKGNGGMVGPQLDGIGNWGHKALTEKILDPNRNVTEAFRTYTITLTNDEQRVGLYRRTEGETMVFADMTGQEFSLPKKSIREYKASGNTIMPDQFRYTIPEKEFYELVTYLLSVK